MRYRRQKSVNKRPIVLLLFAVAVFLNHSITACYASPAPGPQAQAGVIRWVLEEIDGKPVLEKTSSDGMGTLGKPFLEVDLVAGLFSGMTSCNNVLGKIVVNGSRIEFGTHIITALGCSGRVEQQEREFLKLLAEAKYFNISGPVLELSSDQRVLLRLVTDVPPLGETGKKSTVAVRSGCATAIVNTQKAAKTRKPPRN